MNSRKHLRRKVYNLLDNDEISPEEAGFMLGYFS